MTAAGVPATDDSGRGEPDRCTACGYRHNPRAWCSATDGQGGFCTCDDPTLARPGTAELREEIAEWMRTHLFWGLDPSKAPDAADAVLSLLRVQRLLAVEQRDEPITWPELVRRTTEDVTGPDDWSWTYCIACGSTDVTTRGLILEDGPCGALRRVAWCERVGCDVDRAQTDYLLTPRRALGGGDDA